MKYSQKAHAYILSFVMLPFYYVHSTDALQALNEDGYTREKNISKVPKLNWIDAGKSGTNLLSYELFFPCL